MARQRFIYPDFWSDEDIAELTPTERLFFIGCFSNADDEGRLLGNPPFLRSTIFPYDDFTLEQIVEMRDHVLRKCRNLMLYEYRGREYLAFLKWRDYQHPRYPKPSKLPPPPDNPTEPQLPDDNQDGDQAVTIPQPNGNQDSNHADTASQPSGNQDSTRVDTTTALRVGLGWVGKGSSSTSTSAIVKFWQDNRFGMITPVILDRLKAYIEDDGLQADLVLWALEQAVASGPEKQNLRYVRGILDRCRRQGIRTREEAEAAGKRRQRDGPKEPEIIIEERPE